MDSVPQIDPQRPRTGPKKFNGQISDTLPGWSQETSRGVAIHTIRKSGRTGIIVTVCHLAESI